MSWIQVVVLAIVQGLTEFLPISSSGHLVLVPSIFDWEDQGLVFDIAVHFGSLTAVCIYFRTDISKLIGGGLAALGGDMSSGSSKLAIGIALATIPAAVAGLLFADWIETHFRSPAVVVTTLAAYGVLLAIADRFGAQNRDITTIRIRDAFVIGLAQALSLVPGTSRSGVTITAAMAMGLKRRDAARFSFLLSVPVILLATLYKGASMLLGEVAIVWGTLSIAALISAIVAYLSIEFFMRFVNAIGLVPFAIYRLILAGVIFYVLV
jgi:undecaprenyl-diphosphatase